jgi:hypothetical protein
LKCPNCGVENPENYVYCGRCGAIVLSSAKIDRQKVEQIKGNIKNIIATRKVTDRFIPPWWLAVYYIGWIAAFVFFSVAMVVTSNPDMMLVATVVFLAVAAALSLFQAMIMYYLVKRQNAHYRREWDLRANILNLFKALAGSPDREYLVYRDIAPMLATHQKAEPVRDPRFWAAIWALPFLLIAIIMPMSMYGYPYSLSSLLLIAVLVIIFVIVALVCGILGLYSFYFLGKTMHEHERRWIPFSYGTRRALVQFGIPFDWSYPQEMLPDREFAVYLILSIFIPFFTIYWWYTLIVDPNNHFKAHRRYEKWLVGALDQLHY